MSDAMDRAEAAAQQDTLDDQLARQTIADLRASQTELRDIANAALAQAGIDAEAKATAEAKLEQAYARADALATKLAGSSPRSTWTRLPHHRPDPSWRPPARHRRPGLRSELTPPPRRPSSRSRSAAGG